MRVREMRVIITPCFSPLVVVHNHVFYRASHSAIDKLAYPLDNSLNHANRHSV